MTYFGRMATCAAISVAGHLLLASGSAHLPPEAKAAQPVVLQVQLRAPVPAPELEQPSPAESEASKKPIHEAPRPTRRTPTDAKRQENVARNTPPTERPATNSDSTDTPVFGISMESTSTAGAGPAVRVGNTLRAAPGGKGDAEAAGKALREPVQAYEVTKMPLPKGRCSGKYTDEARQAGLEGTVVFDIVVGEDGRVRDIALVQGLGHGLTEEAKRAMKACTFTPGERDGKPVPVRVRGFKIRYALESAE
jgi:TonB family protein